MPCFHYLFRSMISLDYHFGDCKCLGEWLLKIFNTPMASPLCADLVCLCTIGDATAATAEWISPLWRALRPRCYLFPICEGSAKSEKILNGTVNWFVEGSQQKYKILAEKLVAVPSFICGKPALTRRRIPKAMTTGEQRTCLMRMWKQAFNEHWSKIQTQWMHLVSGVPKNTAAKIRP